MSKIAQDVLYYYNRLPSWLLWEIAQFEPVRVMNPKSDWTLERFASLAQTLAKFLQIEKIVFEEDKACGLYRIGLLHNHESVEICTPMTPKLDLKGVKYQSLYAPWANSIFHLAFDIIEWYLKAKESQKQC